MTKYAEPGTHEEHIQRVLKIMARDAIATYKNCGGDMDDIPFVTQPHEMAAQLLTPRESESQ